MRRPVIRQNITAFYAVRAYDERVNDKVSSSSDLGRKLRLLTFNIQSGTPANSYREYLTSSWRQVLPSAVRVENLEAIAGLVMDYDMVGLQEVDSGSLRSGFINQSRYIATHAALPDGERRRKIFGLAMPLDV